MEVGPTLPGDMGQIQLTHTELRNWQENIGLCLAPWEVRFVKALSWQYLGQAQLATKPGCPPPFGSYVQRAIVARKIDEFFG